MSLVMFVEAVPMWLSFRRFTIAQTFHLYLPVGASWVGWASSFFVAALFVAHSCWRYPQVAHHMFDAVPLKVLAVPFAIVTGSMEELWFRMQAMNWSATHGQGPVLQVLTSAAFFGLVLAVWGAFARRWMAALTAMAATSVLGIGLGAVYLASGRHVGPCMGAHIVINLLLEPWLLLSVITQSSMATSCAVK